LSTLAVTTTFAAWVLVAVAVAVAVAVTVLLGVAIAPGVLVGVTLGLGVTVDVGATADVLVDVLVGMLVKVAVDPVPYAAHLRPHANTATGSCGSDSMRVAWNYHVCLAERDGDLPLHRH
jgi:hypothetical protein